MTWNFMLIYFFQLQPELWIFFENLHLGKFWNRIFFSVYGWVITFFFCPFWIILFYFKIIPGPTSQYKNGWCLIRKIKISSSNKKSVRKGQLVIPKHLYYSIRSKLPCSQIEICYHQSSKHNPIIWQWHTYLKFKFK